MSKNENQKLKLLALLELLWKHTDQAHPLPLSALRERLLADYGIEAERKSLYDDIARLGDFGLEILFDRGRGYYLGERLFEPAELRLLVDAVRSCRIVSAGKANTLIEKLASLAGEHQAGSLRRQVYLAGGRTATAALYSIDVLHEAIQADRQIRFCYWEWTPQGERRPRRDGALYTVSPYHLIWDDEYYYLIGYDATRDAIRHYRVDKMKDVQALPEPRRGEALFRDFDLGDYADGLFGMFGGERELVELRCANAIAGAVIDRFGSDAVIACEEEHFRIRVAVRISPLFLSYIMGFGCAMQVLSPPSLKERLCEQARAVLSCYEVPPAP